MAGDGNGRNSSSSPRKEAFRPEILGEMRYLLLALALLPGCVSTVTGKNSDWSVQLSFDISGCEFEYCVLDNEGLYDCTEIEIP